MFFGYGSQIVNAEVLATRQQQGHLPTPEPQRPEDGQSDYVIHPVLKHLAVLGRQGCAGSRETDERLSLCLAG